MLVERQHRFSHLAEFFFLARDGLQLGFRGAGTSMAQPVIELVYAVGEA